MITPLKISPQKIAHPKRCATFFDGNFIRTSHTRNRRLAEQGFTLIEVAIAILLLAVSLTMIVALQSAVVEQSVSDSEREEALLYARSIISSYEIAENQLPETRRNVALYNLLKDSNLLPTQERGLEERLKKFTVDIELIPWKLPGLEIAEIAEKGLIKVTLRIMWGEGDAQKVEIDYFVPAPDVSEEES